MADDKFDEIIKEIKKSRTENNEQHETILESADVSMKLSKTVQDVLDDFSGFRKTLVFVRNSIMTIGVFYIIFKDTIHKIIGE